MDILAKTRFLDACAAGRIGEVRKLVSDHGAGLLDRAGDAGIHRAARQGHLDIVQFLLGLGQPINRHGFNGAPLFVAAYEGRLEVVRHLLDCGADINSLCSSGTPLIGSLYKPNHEVMRLLLDRGAIVFSAADKSDAESGNALLNEDGYDALFWVFAYDDEIAFIELAKRGLIKGASDDVTPLDMAISDDPERAIPKIVTTCLNDPALSGEMTVGRIDAFIARCTDPAVLRVLRAERTRMEINGALVEGVSQPALPASRRSMGVGL